MVNIIWTTASRPSVSTPYTNRPSVSTQHTIRFKPGVLLYYTWENNDFTWGNTNFTWENSYEGINATTWITNR